MKSIINKKAIWVAALSALSLCWGCNDAKYDIIENAVYLSDAETGTSKKVVVDDAGGSSTISVRMAKGLNHDVKVTLVANKEVLDSYNKKNGTEYVMLPEEFYSLSEKNITIKGGNIVADPISIKIKPLSTELSESGNLYAIPISIASVTDGPEVLEPTKSFVLLVDRVVVTSVPVINSSNNIKMTMRKDYALSQWSVEFRVNIDKLGENIGQLNNQAMFAAFAPNGMDGEIYSRFGDAPIKGSIFQCKNQGTQFNSNTEFKKNTWYHLAIVNDGSKIKFYINGKLDIQIDSPGKITNLSKDKFSFGNKDYLKANVMVSELRFWTKAINQTQIVNNMFAVNPKSDGLEAYFKLNEGTGNQFKDYTGNGNTAVAEGTTNWIHNVRSDEQK